MTPKLTELGLAHQILEDLEEGPGAFDTEVLLAQALVKMSAELEALREALRNSEMAKSKAFGYLCSARDALALNDSDALDIAHARGYRDGVRAEKSYAQGWEDAMRQENPPEAVA